MYNSLICIVVEENKILESFSEEKIKELCSVENLRQRSRWKFWPSEVYGIGRALRESSYFYPKKVPLYLYSNHSPFYIEIVSKHELENDAPVQIFNWIKSVNEFKKKSKKPCFNVQWPYIRYRKNHKIERAKDATGTIVFPTHTTDAWDDEFNQDKYIQDLKNLPEKFHPVSICIHKHDVDKGLHEVYLKAGFKVYTAGHYADERYIDRFYEILRNFKYSTSNELGACGLYSVELGIPYFTYGERSKLINKSDDNFPKGYLDRFQLEGYKEEDELFVRNPFAEEIVITEGQKKFVYERMGLDAKDSRLKITLILWFAFVLYKINIIKKFMKHK